MGFKVLGTRDAKWEPRKGLEGPFWFVDRVLYYDPKEGSYWDPTTDFYVEQSEMDYLNQKLVDILAR
jgi:hypothetical protein